MTEIKTEIKSCKPKGALVRDYVKRFFIDTFIETGTYTGDMVTDIAPHVKKVYSIELDEKLYEFARERFRDNSHIHLYQGDSGEILPKILSTSDIKEPCLFWLDAHYSGGITAKGDTDTPVLKELSAILESPYDHVILIDDARCYVGDDYPTIETIRDIVHKVRPDWSFEVKDDIIRICPQEDFISMMTLGQFGQYGNQIFQYAGMKEYARKNKLKLEIPEEWVGRQIFIGCDDPPITGIPREQKMVEGETPIWMNGELKNCDIKGYFQYHTSCYDKDYFRSLFRIQPELKEEVTKAVEILKSIVDVDGYVKKSVLIGIHIRRGDFQAGNRSANIAPIEWYLKWLEENWDELYNPLLFIASDDIDKVAVEFDKYKPRTFDEDNFLCDHYVLRHCDCLLISNSTFSFTAAMLNETGTLFLRPDFGQKKMIPFDPWNSQPTLDVSQVFASMDNPLKLHLGCGDIHKDGYVNMDVRALSAVDLIGDIRELPFADNSVEIIETYHTFEHLPVCLHANVDSTYGEKYKALIDVLKEWNRVLKKDGQLVIEVPDFDKVIEEYLTAPEEKRDELLLGVYGSFRNNEESDYHRWGANEYRLRYMLGKAGFRYIKFCEPQDYHAKTSPCLHVEAIK